MPEPQDLMRYQMEDAAMAVYLYPGNELSLASIAISMKRIADALDKIEPKHPINSYDLRNAPNP